MGRTPQETLTLSSDESAQAAEAEPVEKSTRTRKTPKAKAEGVKKGPKAVSTSKAGTESAIDNTSVTNDNSPVPAKIVGTDNGDQAEGTAWVERALEALGLTLEHIPQDAPGEVLEGYRELRGALLENGGGLEFGTTPDEQPPVMFKGKGAAVENSVETRPGWKPSVLKTFKPLREAISVDASPRVREAYTALQKAVSGAKPGAA